MQTNGITANGITLDCVTSDSITLGYNAVGYNTVASSTAITPGILAYAPATGTIPVQEEVSETLKKAEALKEISRRANGKKYGIPDEDPDAKTALRSAEGKIHVGIYKDGKLDRIANILPAIEDVKIYNQNTVVISFADGTKEIAKVDEKNDYFDIEQGVSVCIAKKLLSDKTDGNGTSVYNKLVKYALGVEAENRKAEAKAISKEREHKERLERRRRKAREKRKEKANARREEMIETQAEAYVRAMQKLKESE